MRKGITLYDPSSAPASEAQVWLHLVAIGSAALVVLVTAFLVWHVYRCRSRRGFGVATLDLLSGRLGLDSRERKALCVMAKVSGHEDCPAALLLSRSAFVSGLSAIEGSCGSKRLLAASERLARRMGLVLDKPIAQIEQKPGKRLNVSPRRGSETERPRARGM